MITGGEELELRESVGDILGFLVLLSLNIDIKNQCFVFSPPQVAQD
jgi:hypothetical protein